MAIPCAPATRTSSLPPAHSRHRTANALLTEMLPLDSAVQSSSASHAGMWLTVCAAADLSAGARPPDTAAAAHLLASYRRQLLHEVDAVMANKKKKQAVQAKSAAPPEVDVSHEHSSKKRPADDIDDIFGDFAGKKKVKEEKASR